MTLVQMRYFIEVCKCLNITKAAKNLHISQPSLTVAIKELEKEFNISLFQRIHQRIYLTKEGALFYERVTDLMAEFDEFSDQMKDMGKNRNLVRVGIPPMMGSFLFPQIFSGFRRENPNIKVEIVEHGALEVQRSLMNESIDLSMLIQESILHKGIQFLSLMSSDFVLCVHPSHPLAERGVFSLSEIEKEPLVLFNKGFYLTNAILEGFAKDGLSPNIVLETSQINTIKQLVKSNLVISILIKDCVTPDDHICTIPLKDLPSVTIGIGWKRQRQLTSDALVMIKTIKRLFEPQCFQ